jgi:hypothetical protein
MQKQESSCRILDEPRAEQRADKSKPEKSADLKLGRTLEQIRVTDSKNSNFRTEKQRGRQALLTERNEAEK